LQNQNQNTGVIFPDNQTSQPVVSIDATADSQALLSSPAPSLASYPVPLDQSQAVTALPPKKQNLLIRLARRADIVLAILLVLGSVGLVIIKNSPNTTSTSVGQFESTTLPLGTLAASDSIPLDTRSVRINGSLILTPSTEPTVATAGQMYYDQTSNVLSYYNGTDFVSLAGGESTVTSIQGQAGSVTLTAGQGIGISGTTISNTGVVNLIAGNAGIVITKDGAGNNTLTVSPGSTVTLQAAYDAGNTIALSAGRQFIVQDGGINVFSISPAGGAVVLRNSTNTTTALQVQTADGTNSVLDVDTTNQRVGVNTAAPASLLQVNQNNLTPGTVTNLASSANVTGTGTTFLTTFQPGDTFTVTSSGDSCVVQQITSDTALVCRAALTNAATGSAYSFTQTERFSVANNSTTNLPGTVILSNPYNTSARFSFRSDELTNDLTIGANVIGNPSDDGGSDTNTDYIQASVFNSGSGGTIDSIRVCFTTMDATNKGFKVAVYTDNAGSPGALLSAANPPAGTGAVGWSTASLGTTVTLDPNTNYWLAHTTQVGVTTRYCRQDGGTTKYQSTFPWGTNFPANYTTTDITSTTIAAYAPYITITDHSSLTSAIKVTENNEVTIRPIYNSDTAFQVLRKDGSVTMSVNNFDRYVFANQMMVGGADVNYRMFLIGNDTNGVIGARRTSNTATDSIMELFSDVGGAASLKLKVQADGTLRLGGSTPDTTGALLVLDTKNDSGDPSVVDGAMYYNSASGALRCAQSGAWVSCVGGLVAVNTSIPGGNTIANTAAETNFASNWSMPASYCVAGRTIRWTAQGTYSTTGTPTLIFKLKAGSTALATSPTFTTGSGASNREWRIEGQTICNAAPAASAATESQGLAEIFTAATTSTPGEMVNTATTNVATNGALTMQISAQWGAADPANTITMRQFIVEAIGP